MLQSCRDIYPQDALKDPACQQSVDIHATVKVFMAPQLYFSRKADSSYKLELIIYCVMRKQKCVEYFY